MGIRYFVTGSTATIAYGEPRFTNDIDIVVDLPANMIGEFCRHFPENDYYVSDAAALDAVRTKTQFNIVHGASGLKVNVMIPVDSPFNRSLFARTREMSIDGGPDAWFASPEDAILKKMVYYREGVLPNIFAISPACSQ
jgi:hypothetical protein